MSIPVDPVLAAFYHHFTGLGCQVTHAPATIWIDFWDKSNLIMQIGKEEPHTVAIWSRIYGGSRFVAQLSDPDLLSKIEEFCGLPSDVAFSDLPLDSTFHRPMGSHHDL